MYVSFARQSLGSSLHTTLPKCQSCSLQIAGLTQYDTKEVKESPVFIVRFLKREICCCKSVSQI